MPVIDVNNATNKFWVIVSSIGICVCGSLTLLHATGGLWKGAGMYLLFTFCNIYTLETRRRKL